MQTFYGNFQILFLKSIEISLVRFRNHLISRSEVLCKRFVLKNFQKFLGKHLCRNLVLLRVFSCKVSIIFQNNFFYNTCQQLLMNGNLNKCYLVFSFPCSTIWKLKKLSSRDIKFFSRKDKTNQYYNNIIKIIAVNKE